MIKGISISVILGYITGCVVASFFKGCMAGGIIVAMIWAIPMLPLVYGIAGGTVAVVLTAIALLQLIVLSIVGKIKHIPWLIFGSTYFAVGICSFLGGVLALESAMR